MVQRTAADIPDFRVLVIDDEPGTAEMLRDYFSKDPYEFLHAADGRSGLAMALDKSPDLILLDLHMPGLDGIDVANQLKSSVQTRGITVILLTAERRIESKIEAFEAGADDYIVKPFACQEIETRIRSMVSQREKFSSLEGTVANLKSSNEELEQLLMVDEKTGLYNFREFQRRLRQEWHRAERYEMDLSLVFLDLDHFKEVNDTLGHQAGDRVLQEFATLVAGGARANDIAARYGGEEFAVILPHTDDKMAGRVAERIRRAVEDFTFLADTTPTRITVSIGVATFPSSRSVESVDSLVRAADIALYGAKDLGRNRVVGNDPNTVTPSITTRGSGARDTV